MSATQINAPGKALVMYSVMSLLTLVLPPSIMAQETFLHAIMLPGAPVVCPESQGLTPVLQALRTAGATAAQGMPAAHDFLLSPPQAAPPSQEPVDHRLQVPPTLMRTLLAPEQGRRQAIELRVPEALLTILATEGLNQTP